MGSIKNTVNKESKHELTEEEFNYVMNVNQAKQNIIAEYNRVMSAFLNYIAKGRMGYDSAQDLEFQLDFSDKTHTLTVKKI